MVQPRFVERNQGAYVDKYVSDWLYGDWNEEKYNKFKQYYSLPVVRDYFDYLLDKRADQEYFKRYGMDFSNIHDPRKLSQTGSASRLVGSSYRMISRNVGSLYRDSKRHAVSDRRVRKAFPKRRY